MNEKVKQAFIRRYPIAAYIINCCGEFPIVWVGCESESMDDCCFGCVEKIECPKCERIIYGFDEESIQEWNDGKNDDAMDN